MLRIFLVCAAVLALATACSSVRETDPERTATEQLLMSSAVDRALPAFDLAIPPGTTVWVDESRMTGFSEGEQFDAMYAVGSIRDYLLRHGARLVEAREKADVVAELRTGALSANRRSDLLGIPSIPLPIPLVGVVETPELALYSRKAQHGIAKLAMTLYSAKDGQLAAYSPERPAYGVTDHTKYTVLFFFNWTDTDVAPEAVQKQDSTMR